jgi:Kdo2-lipid IVA lauroyltransferase/acyltransferase
MLSYYFINFLSFLFSLVPRRGLLFFSHLVAFICFSLLRVRRKLVLRNLDIVYQDKKNSKQKNNIAYFSYYNFFLTCFEFLAQRDGKLGNNIEIVNRHFIDQALQQKKGAYILCIHMGSWEAMGGAFTRLFGPSHIVVKSVGPKGVDDFVTDLRQKNGFYSLRRGRKGEVLDKIKEKLSKNEIVGFVIDQKRPKSPKLPFFNRLAKTNTTLAYLWSRNRAPVVPAFITRDGRGKYKIEVLPPVDLVVSNNKEEDVLKHSRLFNRAAEKMILSCPEQYFWLHNRWGLKN